MISKSNAAAVALAWFLTCHCSFAGSAPDADVPDHQRPPAEQDAVRPAPEAAPEKQQCVNSNADFKTKGGAATFEVELINTCNKRVKCTIDAFVTGAKGPVQGHGTLTLAAAAKGQRTSKTYIMKVKSAGGMANVAHSCKAI